MEQRRPEEEQGPQSDGELFAQKARLVLQKRDIAVDDPEVARILGVIAAATLEEATVLVMDLMGNCGLEPDEAFAEVLKLVEGTGAIEAVEQNISQRVAAICAELLAEHGKAAPAELEALALRAPTAALGIAADLLVNHGVFASTQGAIEAIDPDSTLRAEAAAQMNTS